jgi:hypothetical protein
MTLKEMKSLERRKPATGAERRTDRRYNFTGTAQLTDLKSDLVIDARVRDLGRRGCYVDTDNPLSLGSLANISIRSDGQVFNAQGKVVYSLAGKGMGIFFAEIGHTDLPILETWLSAKIEASWLDSNRRKSQRILMRVPVHVAGVSAANAPFNEDTFTEMINAHGALILVSCTLAKGQKLTLENTRTGAALECVVVFVDRRDLHRVGVSFVLACADFWQVTFPPADWTPHQTDGKKS